MRRRESVGQILHSASAERETPPCTYRFTAPGALGRVWMDGGVASVSHLDRLAIILRQERKSSDVAGEVDEQIEGQIAFLFAPVVLYWERVRYEWQVGLRSSRKERVAL